MKKYIRILRAVSLHLSFICSIVILTAGILDWYNPYMNFSGQIRPLEILQVCLLAVLILSARRSNPIKRNKIRR
ncbi:MAG: hypothetical protein ACOYA9_02410 [Bilifractor sp.]